MTSVSRSLIHLWCNEWVSKSKLHFAFGQNGSGPCDVDERGWSSADNASDRGKVVKETKKVTNDPTHSFTWLSRLTLEVGGGGIAKDEEGGGGGGGGWQMTRSMSTLCPVGAFLFVIGVNEGEGEGRMYPFDLLMTRLSCRLLPPPPVPPVDAELDSFKDDFLLFGLGSTSSKLGLRWISVERKR